jgi:hypothetical protein
MGTNSILKCKIMFKNGHRAGDASDTQTDGCECCGEYDGGAEIERVLKCSKRDGEHKDNDALHVRQERDHRSIPPGACLVAARDRSVSVPPVSSKKWVVR